MIGQPLNKLSALPSPFEFYIQGIDEGEWIL